MQIFIHRTLRLFGCISFGGRALFIGKKRNFLGVAPSVWANSKMLPLLAMAFSTYALAEDAPIQGASDDPAASQIAPAVTVTRGLRSIQPIDEPQPEAHTGFSRIVPRAQFNTVAGSVADVVSQQPGVQLRSRGGLGSTSEIFLRGSNSQQVNVYLDGLLLNAAAGGGVDLSQFLLNGISSVEIYPDITPVQLGFPNLAGAVNIRTRKQQDGQNDLQLGAGSFGAENAGIHLSRAVGAHSFLFTAESLSAENDFEFLNNNNTEFNKQDDRTEERHNAQFDQINGLVKYEYELSANSGLQFMVLGNHKEMGLPSINNSPDSRSSLNTESQQWQARYFRQENSGAAWALRTYYARNQQEYDDRQGNIGLGTSWSHSTTDTVGVNPTASWQFGAHRITTSLDGKQETYRQSNLLRNEGSPDWRRNGVSLGIQEEWQNRRGNWLVAPSVSLLRIEDKGNLSSISGQSDIERSDTYTSGSLGVRHLLNAQWAVKANLARNVRMPSLYELMGDRGYIVGRPTLLPEKALATDFGVEYQAAGTTASIVGFHRNLDDALVINFDSRGVGRYSNIASAEIQGIEMQWTQSLLAGFEIGLRSTLQDSRDRTQRALEGGKQLPNIYKKANSVSLIHRYEYLENRIDYSVEEGGFYASGESVAIPDKRLLDYSLRYRWEAFQVGFEARNLLDEQYQDYHRFPAPGRSYFVKVGVEF
ncbi:Outer membrane protein, TonB dependent [gamma proteobacterium HdN1]|nr:Outer membrane protein, TonB dependent [gamma proteobacterium HdN1]